MKVRICRQFLFVVLSSVMVGGIFLSNPARAVLPADLRGAIDDIYSVNFSSAHPAIDSYIAANPNDAVGFIVRGMLNEWDQVVNNKKKALNAIITRDYQKAVELGEAALKTAPDDTDKMVILGNAHMYLAKKFVDDGAKMKGGFELKKSKNLMLDAIAKDPNNYDAYMALGVFNYFSENVPSGFKWLASLLGFKGNKTDGLNYLKKAAENDNLTRGDAGYLLVYIYGDKEKNYATALQYNGMLTGRYPDNPAFRYQTGELEFQQKKYGEAITTLNGFLDFCKSRGANFCSGKYLFMSNHVIAKSHIRRDNLAGAEPFVIAALKLDEGQYKDRSVDLDLWRGLLAKKSGDSPKAGEFFRKVEKNKGVNDEAWQAARKEMATGR